MSLSNPINSITGAYIIKMNDKNEEIGSLTSIVGMLPVVFDRHTPTGVGMQQLYDSTLDQSYLWSNMVGSRLFWLLSLPLMKVREQNEVHETPYAQLDESSSPRKHDSQAARDIRMCLQVLRRTACLTCNQLQTPGAGRSMHFIYVALSVDWNAYQLFSLSCTFVIARIFLVDSELPFVLWFPPTSITNKCHYGFSMIYLNAQCMHQCLVQFIRRVNTSESKFTLC